MHLAAVSPLLLLCALLSVVAAQPQLPELPDEFSVYIEGAIINRNYTVQIHEYYDYVNNRVRIDNERPGRISTHIYDYSNQRHYSITNGVCVVTNSTLDPGRNADPSADGLHLRRAAELFDDTKDLNYTYLGKEIQRGILCDRWTANQSIVSNRTNSTITFTIDWFWTDGNWSMRNIPMGTPVPTLCIVTGTDSRGPFSHYYNWVDYEIGTPDPNKFMIPTNVFCPDFVQKPLPQIADDFSADIERNNALDGFTDEIREWFDYDKNLARIETNLAGINRTRRGGSGSAVHFIDGNTGKFYILTINPDGTTSCNVTTQPDYLVSSVYNTTTHHLANFYPGFFDGYTPTFLYGGLAYARGIPCDHWQATHTTTNFSRRFNRNVTFSVAQDWFWSSPNWTMYQHAQTVPIQMTFSGSIRELNGSLIRNFQAIYNYVDVSFDDIPESKLQIPAGCPGAPAQVEEAPSNTSKGLIVGVAIGAAAIGLLIGFIVYTMIQRRKSGTDQYQLHTSLTSSDH